MIVIHVGYNNGLLSKVFMILYTEKISSTLFEAICRELVALHAKIQKGLISHMSYKAIPVKKPSWSRQR